MNLDQLRTLCKTFPHATEQLQWEDNLVFKVGGKMFAIASTEPGPIRLSFKVTPERFAELTEAPGVIPAPYLARAKWIALERWDALPHAELAALVRGSYDLVFATLPAATRKKLTSGSSSAPRKRRP